MDGCVKLDLGNAFWRKAEEIINISLRVILPTLAVVWALARDTRIEGAGERRDTSPEHVDHGPDDSLHCQGGGPVSETKGSVKINLAAPAYSEEDRGDRIEDKPSIPARHIEFKYKDALARILPPRPLNATNDGLGSW